MLTSAAASGFIADDVRDQSVKKEEWCSCIGKRKMDPSMEENKNIKQSGNYEEEPELWKMFERILLSDNSEWSSNPFYITPAVNSVVPEKNEPKESEFSIRRFSVGKTEASGNDLRTRGNRAPRIAETVDLRDLLVSCSRAVAVGDHRTATDLLDKVRKNSSPLGDGEQRCAHYFANGLEARLNHRSTEIFADYAFRKPPALDMLNFFKLFDDIPFRKIANAFSNHHILKLAERVVTIHVIDFGILHGYQWPIVIKQLSARVGGPPNLRITGIELPESGLRPERCAAEAGRRLSKCCERFGVPFHYNAVVKKWHAIKLEDLEICSDEVVVVNCAFRLKNMPDDAAHDDDGPKDAVLRLIRQINPEIFVHAVNHGSHTSPFFACRFREAMHYFSTAFDSIDSIMGDRGSRERLVFEREYFGREVMNVIACEGYERIELPEKYQKWHARTAAAGFRPVPVDRELNRRLGKVIKGRYHKDFGVEAADGWLLLEWKGRIAIAMSCWTPAVNMKKG